MIGARVSLFFIFLLASSVSFAARELHNSGLGESNESRELSPNVQVAVGVGVGCAAVALRSVIARYIGDLYCGPDLTSGMFHQTSSNPGSLGMFLAYHAASAVAVEAIRELAVPLVCKAVAGRSKKRVDVEKVKNASRAASGVALLGYHQVINGCRIRIAYNPSRNVSQSVFGPELSTLLDQAEYTRQMIREQLARESR